MQSFKATCSRIGTDSDSNDRSLCSIDHRCGSEQHVNVSGFSLVETFHLDARFFSLLDVELKSYLTLHPPIAKRALYCLCALHPTNKDELLRQMIDVRQTFLLPPFQESLDSIVQDTQYDQFDSDQFITRLVLLGHMVQLAPIAVGDLGKRILSNVSKYVVEKVNQSEDENDMATSFFNGQFTLLPDEPHADREIGADSRA